jgi:hypothetical protein
MERIFRCRKGLSGGRVLVVGLGAAFLLAGAPQDASAQEKGGEHQLDVTSPLTKGTRAVGYKHKEGEYGGVTPGVIYPYADEDAKKRFRRPSPKHKNALYWIGFQAREGGASRVFAQLAREVEYDQRVENNVLLVDVFGVRHRSRNTLRRIETRFFDTAIKEIRGKRVRKRRARKDRPAQKAGVRIAISFKNPVDAAQATASVSREEDGYYYLYLDFGPGTALPEEPESEEGGSPGAPETQPSE